MSSCDENQSLLGRSRLNPFNKNAVKCLALTEVFLGIACICLALSYPGMVTPAAEMTVHRTFNSSLLSVFEGILQQNGKNKTGFMYIVLGSGATMVINGLVGFSSVARPRSQALNAANFWLGSLCFLYALFLMFLCNLSTYIDGAESVAMPSESIGIWHIASIESLAYLESLVALGVLLVCWVQKKKHWCSCFCACNRETCRHGQFIEGVEKPNDDDVIYETMTGHALQNDSKDEYMTIRVADKFVNSSTANQHVYENI